MKTINYNNRTCITIHGHYSTETINTVYAIASKHNAQTMLFENKNTVLSHDRSHMIHGNGSIGGTITFHSHSCNHDIAAKELMDYLGEKVEFWHEVVKTHRADGTAYKCPQYFLERR